LKKDLISRKLLAFCVLQLSEQSDYRGHARNSGISNTLPLLSKFQFESYAQSYICSKSQKLNYLFQGLGMDSKKGMLSIGISPSCV
jgi:hypothetical protein